MDKSKSKNIGFYIRVSTEEQAENPEGSIKNQEERLRQLVSLRNMSGDFGEVTEVFIDRAKSGKDTNRPELQRMLEFIRQKKINLVMISEVSRISRSMRDFSEIWELMQSHGCGIMSLRENFDTSTAAGEMVLYSIANISQFERRQVSERVAANMKIRAERGLYNGGSVPMGYKLIQDKPGYLDVEEEQANIVRKAFEMFLEEQTLSKTVKALNDNGYRLKRQVQGGGRNMRLSQFTVDNLHKMLTNPTYIGKRRFKDKGETKITNAVWVSIIDESVFNRVNEILKKNHSRKKPHSKTRYPYLLSGITFCKACGDAMSGKSAHGRNGKFGYYEHSWRTKRNSSFSKKQFQCDNFDRIPAKKLEAVINENVGLLLNNKELSQELLKEARASFENNSHNKEAKSLKAQMIGYNSQLDALTERLSELPKTISAKPFFKQMEKIEERKSLCETSLDAVKRKGLFGRGKPMELNHYQGLLMALKGLWQSGDSQARSKIIQWLIHKIEVSKDSVHIHYQLGESHLLRELDSSGSRLLRHKKSDNDLNPVASRNFLDFFKLRCSNTLTVGAPGGT